jgi:hypothetical protein
MKYQTQINEIVYSCAQFDRLWHFLAFVALFETLTDSVVY